MTAAVHVRSGNARSRRRIGTAVLHLVFLAGSVVVAFPFVWMILSSFKSIQDFYNFGFLPSVFDVSAYQYVFTETNFGRWYLNSAIVAVVVTVTNIVFCSLIGYTLAKFRFPGARAVFILILSTLMVPTEMLVIPWYVSAVHLHLANTYVGIFLPGVMEAFGIFLMRQFMLGVPDDLLDAGRVDGLGEFRLWWQVAMPLVKPAIAALGIVTFLGNWNAYLWPVIVIATDQMRTIPVGIALYATAVSNGIQWNTIMAMSVLTVVPMIVVFVIFQRQIISGIALTGLKG